ncbi:MBL fold metallo-hydrolase [Spirochaetota bacterium]
MKKYAQGKYGKFISVAGNPFYPAYVIKGRDKNLMIDAGVNLYGPLYIKTLETILEDPGKLDYNFITHSHYDHLGSVTYLKRKITGLKIGGAPKINDLMKKESVLQKMTALSEVQREMFKDIVGNEDVRLEPFELDFNLKEGDCFDLGDVTVEVYETPGHTQDSLSYFVPQIRALFPGDSIGLPDGIDDYNYQVEFLSSFKDYLGSIEKMISIEPEFVGFAHGFIFTSKDAIDYLHGAHRTAFIHKEMIERYLNENNGDIKKTIEKITKDEYDDGERYQERNAYIENLTAQVNHIAKIKA